MNINPTISESGFPVEETMISAINALTPSKSRQKVKLFEQLLPAIERALARGVTQNEVIATLKARGLPLSVGGFRAQLEAARARLKEAGEQICCLECGAVLLHSEGARALPSSLLTPGTSAGGDDGSSE